MKIVFDGDVSAPEILIGLTLTEMKFIGTQLATLGDTLMISGNGVADRFYPEILRGLIFELTTIPDLQSLVAISLEDRMVCCRGGSEALGKLGNSLLNYFSEPVAEGDHLHIDYHEGSQLLAPTKCHLIIMPIYE